MPKPKPSTLTHARLLEALHYDPETGKWTWLVRPSIRVMIGDEAGCWRSDRLVVTLDGQQYYASRLAWLYMTGTWPPELIDHEDTDSRNGRWRNLRLASCSQNCCNIGLTERNSSGFKGVVWDRDHERWRAQIGHDGKNIYLGLHHTPELAHAAYVEAATRLHGAFARTA